MISMIYGLFQYYTDELAEWNRILKFHKEESGAFERRIAATLERTNISSAFEKESGKFLDLFMVQHQQFDYIMNQIATQQQRLHDVSPVPESVVKNPFGNYQNSLRARMQSAEKNFIRMKYSCSVFLSSVLDN